MKIAEAKQTYGYQLNTYFAKQRELAAEKSKLEEKIKNTADRVVVYKNEATILELQYNAVSEKRQEYQDYMDKLSEQWAAVTNMISGEQQADTMAEAAKEQSKIMEVARRIMHGDKVPSKDEKKLMEYDYKLYSMAKNAAAMLKLQKERKEHKSLWEDEEVKDYADPMEEADNTEAFVDGPEVVEVDDVIASATPDINVSFE